MLRKLFPFIFTTVVAILLFIPYASAQDHDFSNMEKEYPLLMERYGNRLESRNAHYIFAIDISSSMTQYEQVVRESLKTFIQAIPDKDQVTIIVVCDENNTNYLNSIKCISIEPAVRQSIIAAINSQQFKFLRRNDPQGKDAPFRLLGCDYIEAQLHGPIVLGRDVEEIRISETEISDKAEAEYKELTKNEPVVDAKDKTAAEAAEAKKKQWMGSRIQELKADIEKMARASGVKISFYNGGDENSVIASENYVKDLQATRKLVRDANLETAEQVVANEMPVMRQRGYAGLTEPRKAVLTKAFGDGPEQLPEWLKDKITTVARRRVLASIRDVHAGESAVDGASIRNFIVEQTRNVMNAAAELLAALDRYGVKDPGMRESVLREFVQADKPFYAANSYVATNVAIDRVMYSPKTIVAAAMTVGFPASIRAELSELGAKDGLPLGGKGLENLTKRVVEFLSSKLSGDGSTNVDKLIAEARDKVVIPALRTRIDLLRSIANWEFHSDADRKSFVEWAVNSGKLKTLEELKGVYASSGKLADDLAAALERLPLNSGAIMKLYRDFFDVANSYAEQDMVNHSEFGSDDRNAVVFRAVNVAMSRLYLRVGQTGMDKLGKVMSSAAARDLYGAAQTTGSDSSSLKSWTYTVPISLLCTFLNTIGSRLSEKYGQHCDFDSVPTVPFKNVTPEMRALIAQLAPDIVGALSAKTPYEPALRVIPAPVNPVGLPTDLAGRKGFLRAALPTYHQHEKGFDRGVNTHGRTHATRAFVLANVLGNILAERGVPVDMNALSLGIAGHDMGRQGPGEDKWERESGDMTTAMGERLTGGAGGAAWYGAVKANIAGHAPELAGQRTIEGYLLKAADSLDYTRVTKIDPGHLHFMDTSFSVGDVVVPPDIELRRRLIEEAAELTRLTDPYTARKDEMNKLVADGKMVESKKIADEVRADEIKQTDSLSDEDIINLVEKTIHDNLDKFPILNQYYH